MERLRRLDLGALVPALLAVLVSLVIGALIIIAVGESPVTAYLALLDGAFGSADAITSTMVRQVPMLLTGLGYAVAFQSGLINLGAEGQLYMGAFAAGVAGYLIDLPPFLMIPYVMIVGAVAGGLWGGLAGWLKSRFGISEFLTTLMLNYIATFFTTWAANNYFKDRTPVSKGMIAQTQPIFESARLPIIWPETKLHLGYLFALLLVVGVWYFLQKTRKGYEFRMHGANPLFAEYGGINRRGVTRQAMFIAGALAGVGGALEVMGVHYKFVDAFSPGYGFDGVSAAILGSSTPFGTYISSFLFSALRTGALGMDRNTMVPFELRNVVQATVIFFMASNLFVNYGKLFDRFRKKGKEASGVGRAA